LSASVGFPTTEETKVEARTISRWVTPNSLLVSYATNGVFDPAYFLGSKTPAFLRVSAKTGTVELTGLEMTRMKALGQALAMA
jgi:hypothetical protein